MNTEEVFKLWDRFDRSDCTRFEYKSDDVELRLERAVQTPVQAAVQTVVQPSALPETSPAEPAKKAEAEKIPGTVIKAPLVGTFYRAPAPGEEPFAAPGKKVKKGDVLAIIEAMKLMNEITAPCDGTVTRIMVDDEMLVEYDQPLMILGE